MAKNKTLETIFELNKLINELKGNYNSLLEAIQKDPEVGQVAVSDIRAILENTKGGFGSIDQRISSLEASLLDSINDVAVVQNVDIRYLKDEIRKAMQGYPSLQKALENLKSVGIEAFDDTIKLITEDINAVKTYRFDINPNQKQFKNTNVSPLESIVDIMVKDKLDVEEVSQIGNDINIYAQPNIDMEISNDGYHIKESNDSQLITIKGVSYTNLIDDDTQTWETDAINVFCTKQKTTQKDDIRNIFRVDEDLSSGYFLAESLRQNIIIASVFKDATYLDKIRLYPFTSELHSPKYRVFIYDGNENLVTSYSSYDYVENIHNFNKFIDVEIKNTVSYVVLELTPYSSSVSKYGFNKIEFYESDLVVEKSKFYLNSENLPVAIFLNDFKFLIEEDSRNNRNAFNKYGINIDGEVFMYVPNERVLDRAVMRDENGRAPKTDIVRSFNYSNLFKDVYQSYYIPTLDSYNFQDGGKLILFDDYFNSSSSVYNESYHSGEYAVKKVGGSWSSKIKLNKESVLEHEGLKLEIKPKLISEGVIRIIITHLEGSCGGPISLRGCTRFNNEPHGERYTHYSDWKNHFVLKSGHSCYIEERSTQKYAGGTVSHRSSVEFFTAIPADSKDINLVPESRRIEIIDGIRRPTWYYNVNEVKLPLTLYAGRKPPKTWENGETGPVAQMVNADLQMNITNASDYLNDKINLMMKNQFGIYKINIDKSIYPDGFSFKRPVDNGRTVYAFEIEGKTYVRRSGDNVWNQISKSNISTQGMSGFDIEQLTPEMFDGMNEAIKLLVYVGDVGTFTNVIIKTKTPKLIPTTERVIESVGMTAQEVSNINSRVIYNKLKDKDLCSIALIGTTQSKQGAGVIFKKFTKTSFKLEVWRKINLTEKNLLSVNFYSKGIEVTNLTNEVQNLLIKMSTPHETTLIDKNSGQSVKDVINNAESLNTLMTEYKNIENAIYQRLVSKLHEHGAFDRDSTAKVMFEFINNLDGPSFSIYGSERVAADRIDEISCNGYMFPSTRYRKGLGNIFEKTALPNLVIFHNPNNEKTEVKYPLQSIARNRENLAYKIFTETPVECFKITFNKNYTYTILSSDLLISPDYIEMKPMSIKDIDAIIKEQVNTASLTVVFSVPNNFENYSGNMIPKMTSDTEPEGWARAESCDKWGSFPYMAFDRNNNVEWQSARYKENSWIEYEFLNPSFLYKIQIRCGRFGEWSPYYIMIEATKESGEVVEVVPWQYSGVWKYTENEFDIPSGVYKKIRLYCTRRPNASHITLDEMRAIGGTNPIIIYGMTFVQEGSRNLSQEQISNHIKFKIPEDEATEVKVLTASVDKYDIIINGISQKENRDYTMEKRIDGWYMIWKSPDFILETDDECKIVIKE